MKYTDFVRANYGKVSNLPPKQRMAKLGQMWRASGHSSGKGVVGGEVAGGEVAGGIFIKRKGGRKGKKIRGKGILSDALGAFGLGVPEGDGGSVQKKHRGRPSKGKGIVGGQVAGGGLLSDILGSVGLGMPNEMKMKHYDRMCKLEKKLHNDGKLSPLEHHKLKVYHTLHGSGFFDSLWSGIKKGASAVASVVPKAITGLPQVLKVVPEVAKFVPAVAGIASKVAPLAKLAPLAAMMV